MTELFDAVTTDGARIAHEEMTKALTLGFGIDRTGEMLKNAIGISLTRAMTIARTEQMRAYRGAHIGYLRENAEHIAGWVWHADHGWRCCPVCLALDGSFHELSEDFASQPNCRCSPVTVAKDPDGKAELPARETGVEWFAQRSAVEQRELLGPGKYALYKDGKIELADLVRVGKDPKWGPYRVERSLKDVEARLGGTGGGGGEPPGGGVPPAGTLGPDPNEERQYVERLARRTLDDGYIWNQEETERVQRHVRSAGWNPKFRRPVPDETPTSVAQSLQPDARGRIDDETAHWVKHAVIRAEWPSGFKLEQYRDAVDMIINDSSVGIAVMDFREKRQVTLIGVAEDPSGENGGDWIVVHYRTEIGHLTTAMRPLKEKGNLESAGKKRLVWIRRPTEKT